MKKILFTAIAAVLLAGCAKNVNEPDANEIKVEFEIAEKSAFGADTKALKEGWAVGDVIRITFSSDEVGNNYPDFSNNDYTISLVRWNNDGYWKPFTDNLTATKMQDLNGTGTFKAVHYSGGVNFGTLNGFDTSLDYSGGEYMEAEGEYQILAGGVMKLLGVIEMKRPDNLMQISVDDLHIYGFSDGVYEGDTYKLTIEDVEGVTHLTSGSLYLDSQANICVNVNNYSNAQGVTVGNDRAFCFRVMNNNNLESKDPLIFKLSNGEKTYSCTIEGHTLKPGKAYLLPGLNEDHPNGGLFWN